MVHMCVYVFCRRICYQLLDTTVPPLELTVHVSGGERQGIPVEHVTSRQQEAQGSSQDR